MAAALECWSGRPSTDEDLVEQVLMKTHDRSEAYPAADPALPPPAWPPAPDAPAAAAPQKKWQRLGRNFAGAITALKNSLNLDSIREPAGRAADHKALWGGIVRNLTQLYPGSQLPEKAISNIRRHFDSLPNSYAQAGHDMKEVLLHVRLIELAAAEEHPAVHVQEVAPAEGPGEGAVALFRLTFASHSPISWPAMADALNGSSICCKKVQIFEKKGLTLGIATLLVSSANDKLLFKSRAEAALRAAVRRPPARSNATNVVKLPFGLCGCQEQGAAGIREEEVEIIGGGGDGGRQECDRDAFLPNPLPESSLVVAVDEWQTVRSGADEIGRRLLSCEEVELLDRVGTNSFGGLFRGRKAWIKKVRGCERGATYEVEIKRDLLELMTCGHRNILHLHGVCIDEHHGLCLVTRMMEGGSVHDLVQRSKRIPSRDILRIAADAAEGLKFMNDHGVSYRDLNTQRILLDKQGNACLGDMGVVSACKNASGGDVTEYETAGYRWLAPEIIAGDPETVSETWMSNVYSFGMVVWEMVAGEAAYSSYSPVQAAVGIAACGLRPEIPKECPQLLRSLMLKCWNNHPSKRPPFSEILAILSRQITR